MKKMKVSVVIPNWNGEDLLAESLQSIEKQTYPCQIVVVDNGSTDKSVQIIKDKFPKVHLIELTENTGFAGGVNTGLKFSLAEGFDAVALFNNDAEAEPDWLENLVEELGKKEKTGIVTGKLMRHDQKHIDSTGDFYTIWGIPMPRGRNHLDAGQYDQAESVFGASGGASLYRSTMLKEIGLFDERFFAYIEDVDISFRARLAGWDILYTPKAVAYHHVSATTSKMVSSFARYQWIKNYLMTYTKNMPARLYWKYFPLFLSQYLRYGASSTIRGGFWAYIRSSFRFLILSPGVLADRWKIQKSRKVSSSEIDELLVHSRPPKIPGLQQ